MKDKGESVLERSRMRVRERERESIVGESECERGEEFSQTSR